MKPAAGAPACPAHLDAVAKMEWARVVPELERLGVLTVVDGAGLEAYCATYAMAVWFQNVASKMPMIKTSKGDLRTNPAVGEARKHWQLVRQFQAEFGMTPAARTRVSAPEGSGATPDASAAFLFGAGLKVLPGGKKSSLRGGSGSTSASRASAMREISSLLPSPAAIPAGSTSTATPPTGSSSSSSPTADTTKESGPASS
jgi:P27 family predicted phage terminase small subunit